MGFTLSLAFGFIPAMINAGMIYWLDRYEKEPKRLLIGVFLWGAIVAAGGAFLFNSLFGLGVFYLTSSHAAADLTTGSLIAPVIEEALKGAAVLMVFWMAHNEFDSILDGIVYAAVTALGFAATENLYYIYEYGFVQDGFSGLLLLAFVRVVLVGWQHPFYTAFTGIGLAVARFKRSWVMKIVAVAAGWTMAVLMHSLHNTLSYFVGPSNGLVITTVFDWSGWLVMFGFILYMSRRERQLMIQYLGEEVGIGTLSPQQYATACSSSARFRARLHGLLHHSYRATTRFYQSCGEIVHKKRQLVAMGDEDGNQATIERLRLELRMLSPQVRG